MGTTKAMKSLVGGIPESRRLTIVPRTETWREISALPNPLDTFGAATVNGNIYVFGSLGAGVQFSTDVLVYDTGFRAVKAMGKMPTRWGELKAAHQNQP